MYIINIGNEKPQSWLPHIIVTTHLLAKAKMCCFIYSLFDKIMYIIANKATFIVRENPHAYIKNNIIPINTTSLSHSIYYEVKWQHNHACTMLDTSLSIALSPKHSSTPR